MTDIQESPAAHGMSLATVKPGNQPKIIDALRGIGPRAEIPGLISLRVMRSVDGDKLLTYMCWESVEALARAEQLPRVATAIAKINEYIEERGTPGFYHVIYTHV